MTSKKLRTKTLSPPKNAAEKLERLRKVRNFVARSSIFDWGEWGMAKRRRDAEGNTHCQTLACVAGSTPIALGQVSLQYYCNVARQKAGEVLYPKDLQEDAPLIDAPKGSWKNRNWENYMGAVLGLKKKVVTWLCYAGSHAPAGYKNVFPIDYPNRDYRAAAVARLDQVIAKVKAASKAGKARHKVKS